MNDWRPFLYGGVASIVAESGTFPIDTTKTRLQIQGQTIDRSLTELKYRGMSHAFFRIIREEGLQSLYSGIAPALLRQASYGTIKIGVYHTLKRAIVPNPEDETLSINMLCGIVAGIVSSAAANPTDLLKVRMQAKGREGASEDMVHAFTNIYRQEGLRGLWRGVGPTAQRAATVAGVELPAYDLCKKLMVQSGFLGDSLGTHFLASFLAGLAGAIASTPIDVIKTRMMNQKNIRPSLVITGGSAAVSKSIYTSSMDCFLQTVRTEGVMAMYKGFVPTWVRLGPWNIIFFMTYEQMKKIY